MNKPEKVKSKRKRIPYWWEEIEKTGFTKGTWETYLQKLLHARNRYWLRIQAAEESGKHELKRRIQRDGLKDKMLTILAAWETSRKTGARTAGVDGVKKHTLKDILEGAAEVRRSNWEASPIKRVWIPKPGRVDANGNPEMRPLGIPTWGDRVRQRIVLYLLEPEWESKFGRDSRERSYGFRPGKSAEMAMKEIKTILGPWNREIIEGDISKCFDRIGHVELKRKMKTEPALWWRIEKWLTAPVKDRGKLEPTTRGTPQGGVISPLLANIALSGMERAVGKKFPWVKIVRYADDFVAILPYQYQASEVKTEITKFCAEIGLELNETKTTVVKSDLSERECHSITLDSREKPGWGTKFLGWWLRRSTEGEIIWDVTIKAENRMKEQVGILLAEGNRIALKDYIIGWKGYFVKEPRQLITHNVLEYWKEVKSNWKKLP